VGPLDGFRSKQGRAFSANLIMNKEFGIEFSWGDSANDEDGEGPDFSAQESLGTCPKCQSRVFELPNSYTCEKAVGNARTCDFRSGRIILKRPVTREEMSTLLNTGKSPLLEKFISKKGRPFNAYLARQPDGKIGFEFEQRAPGAAGKRGAAASASAGALKILGKHPDDGQVVSVYSGRYGPYVKHGTTNATIRGDTAVEAITLEEALALLAEKSGGTTTKKKAPTKRKKAA